MKVILLGITMFVSLMAPSAAQAMCDAQIKSLQAEMDAKHVTLDVRRKVNTAIQPLIIPRSDLNPLSAVECQKKVQAARELLVHSDVAMASK